MWAVAIFFFLGEITVAIWSSLSNGPSIFLPRNNERRIQIFLSRQQPSLPSRFSNRTSGFASQRSSIWISKHLDQALYLDPFPEMYAARSSRASRRRNIQYRADIIVQRPSEVSFRNLCSPGRMGDYVKRCVSAATVHGNPGVTEILLGDVVTLAHTRVPPLIYAPRDYVSHISAYTYIRPMHCVFVYRERRITASAAAIAIYRGMHPGGRPPRGGIWIPVILELQTRGCPFYRTILIESISDLSKKIPIENF